jgi:hypothetical protein
MNSFFVVYFYRNLINFKAETHIMELMKFDDRKRRKELTIDNVSKLLQTFTSTSLRYNNENIEETTFEDPFHELFIYSIIFNRFL